jgi:AcrR family transcriptional regulator
LILEKAYDSISVKEILERANVGRSTFYMHYRDKDELLASRIHDILRPIHSGEPSSSLATGHELFVWFSLPMLEHIYQHSHGGKAKMGVRGSAIIHEHLRKVLTELIADNIGKEFHARRATASQVPLDLLVQHVAATFILVLNWWLQSRSPLRPAEVNNLFRSLILPTLETTCA